MYMVDKYAKSDVIHPTILSMTTSRRPRGVGDFIVLVEALTSENNEEPGSL